MSDPVVPPKAENMTISPDIKPCCLIGNELKISELIAG